MKIFLIFISFILSNAALATGLEFKCKVGELRPRLENSYQFKLVDCQDNITTPPACGADNVLLPAFDSSTSGGDAMIKSLLFAKVTGRFVEGKIKKTCPSYQPDAPELDYLNILD
ncbi:MAG: hypothetical protein AB8G05_24980 [Oligoflexales bacterium]